MEYKNRTGCPISFAMSSFGDKWTLLILREIIIMKKKYYHEFIEIGEGISTNILANRLKEMEKIGLIEKKQDPNNQKKFIYSPTEKSLDLIPMLFELMLWSANYDSKTKVTREHIECFSKNKNQTLKQWRAYFDLS